MEVKNTLDRDLSYWKDILLTKEGDSRCEWDEVKQYVKKKREEKISKNKGNGMTNAKLPSTESTHTS